MDETLWIERLCGAGASVNWAAWAACGTILAAAATFGAILVALRASRVEHERTLRLRDEEWKRQDDARDTFTAVLAHTFSRELHQAALPLMHTFNELMDAMREPSMDGLNRATEILIMEVPAHRHLGMLRRFASRLEGFTSLQAVGILNAIATWETVTASAPEGLRDVPVQMKIDQIGRRMVAIEQALESFATLQGNLKSTAFSTGFTQEVSTAEIFEEQSRRLDELAKEFAITRRYSRPAGEV